MNKQNPHKTIDSDFLKSNFGKVVKLNSEDIEGNKRFLNRELSWLAFNSRVLEEAGNLEVPLLERLRFLSISSTNLDEFYSVRVAGLRELKKNKINTPAADGLTPGEQLLEIDKSARVLLKEQQKHWIDLIHDLKLANIEILKPDELNPEERLFLDKEFMNNIFPVLSPLAIDPAHPFPFIPNGGFALALQLKRKKDDKELLALLPIPKQLPRFVRLGEVKEIYRMLPLEDVLIEYISDLFPEHVLENFCAFRLLRDSDLEIEEEAEDLVREFETALKRRRRGEVISLAISAGANINLANMIRKNCKVTKSEIFEINGFIALADLSELVELEIENLMWPKFSPRIPERVTDYDGDIFRAIQQKDMLLHHPYETFDMVVRFLQQAAGDPNVLAIKQTLYRTSKNSPIVDALCEAAEAGKSVTAFIELKARFDEAANIRQARRLERAGAHVVYGFISLKTHAKLSTVVRREKNKDLVTYTHFGTGNYHPITAKYYTDLSFFTCDPAHGRDATSVFNFVSGYARPQKLKKMSISPINLKTFLLNSIENEIKIANNGQSAEIWGKMNALIDPDVIDALYKASNAGVKIKLIVRGICGLRPGIEGLSENIQVKSIVGRFLEHSRIICFGNGKPIETLKGRVFISSADWMDRNLNRRVEGLIEIDNETIRSQIVSQIMAANLADQKQSWVLQSDGNYLRHNDIDNQFDCHRFFMENPSLSGRGSAGASDVPELSHSNIKKKYFIN